MDKGEGAFRIAWSGGKPPKKGILTAIEEMAGRPSRIYLPEPPGEDAPLVKIGSADPEDDSRYQVTGEIARGGVGVIYRGRDRDLGRDVALKVLRPEHADSATVVERFIEEAQVGAQLQHPGIVPVYGMGLQADGRPYFSMKLVKGQTLAALLKGRKDPGQERRKFLRIFEQVCQTMAYAHSRGVIHRDLKPANIMVGSYGEVMVVDWGFAKVLGRPEPKREETETIIATVRSTEGSESVSGSVMGTPAYMPPEQALGQVETLDEHADVFALGAILAHVLTDKPPYTGKGHDALVQAAQARLDDCYERLDACGADEALVNLVRRCLSPVSEERPQNAAVLSDEIDAHINAVERRAREAQLAAIEQTETLAREKRRAVWERRTKRTTLTIMAVLLLTAGALALFYVQHGNEEDARIANVLPAVDRALDKAAERKASRDWFAALAAAERALSLASGTAAEPRARGVVESIRLGKQESEAQAEALRQEDAFLKRVRTLFESMHDTGDAYKFDQEMVQAFEEFDLDPRAPRRRIQRRAALLDLVDRWFTWRIEFNATLGGAPKELLVLAEVLDTDSLRRRMRRAVAEGRRGDLIRLTRDVDVDAIPPDRCVTFARFLLSAGAPYDAARFIKAAQDRYPGNAAIQDVARMAYGRIALPEAGHRAALAAATISGHPAHWWMVAAAASQRSRWDEALVAIRRAMASKPRLAGAYIAREIRYLRQAGKLDEELERWRRELSKHPDDFAVRRRLALALYSAGRPKKAYELYRESVPFDEPQLWSEFAGMQFSGGDRAGALESLATCLRMASGERSNMTPYARSLGRLLAMEHTTAQAREWISEHLPALDSTALAALHQGVFDIVERRVRPEHQSIDALEAAQLAVRHRPDIGVYQANLGWALIKNDRAEEALGPLGKAVSLAPTDAKLRTRLGDAYWRTNRVRDAIDAYRHAVETSASALGAAGRLATVAIQAPEHQAEIVSFVRAFADEHSDFAGPQNVAAWTLYYCGEYPSALRYCARALDLEQTNTNAMYTRANVLEALDRGDEAERAWREVLAATPGAAAPRRALGLLLLKGGNVEAASRELSRALRGAGQRIRRAISRLLLDSTSPGRRARLPSRANPLVQ